MIKTANKISYLIEAQLPNFINEEYELFTRFIEKYYEQLELQGQPLDIIHNIQSYRDIDFYEKNILKQSTRLVGAIDVNANIIVVDDARSFPKQGGYIQIDDEICFYSSRTDTEFLEVSRGVSGNTTLGDLYTKSKFVTTQSSNHLDGSTVQNISNLFLYALVKSFEKQYLNDFPEAYLKGEVDKRTLIKNITSFYQSKGTENSIKFLFKCLVENDPNPDISYPRDHTLKSSDSEWINNYALKVKVLSGTIDNLIGKKIEQKGDVYASAIVDNVNFIGSYDGEDLYEIILSESSVNGEFSVASKTRLTKQLDNTSTRVNVFSTMGWGKTGEFNVVGETIKYDNKNINQFVIKSRTGTGTYPIGTPVTYGANVSGEGVSLLIYGVLYNANNEIAVPYSNTGDTVQVSQSGFVTDDIRIFDLQNNLRWISPGSAPQIAAISDLNTNVAAIYEDGEGYYITSSGWPSHTIGLTPSDPQDQKNLKIIRKHPISTTEIYETKYRDVGIAINGIPFVGYKDEDVVLGGPIEKITVTNRGVGYQSNPYVLINNIPNLAQTKLAGQVVESVIIDVPGNYGEVPTIDIISGRNAIATAVITNGVVSSITVDNPGEYYSSPPEVRITDKAGKGRFADFTVQISVTGEVTGFTQINGGSLYTQENVIVDIIPVGKDATAIVSIKEWIKDRFKNATLDSENGCILNNFDPSKGEGYSYCASPTTLRANDTGATHSPILGFAYDGNPIYGAYGYTHPLDPSSTISRMTSGYSINMSRASGPSTVTYSLGTFIDDYTYNDGHGSLDENNGRYCVTPDFPEGTYAYFVTVSDTNSPVFPYILGKNYYSLPLDSNYNSEISQDDLPIRAKRLRTNDIDNNGDKVIAKIEDVRRGSVSSASIVNSGSDFSVGCKVEIDNTGTSGYGAEAEVSSVVGKQVTSIESQQTKILYFELGKTAYLFDGDVITQTVTGAQGYIVGNVFSSTKFALRDVTGTFNSTDVLSSSTTVLSLIVDQNSSYTKGAIISLSDGVNLPVAKGEVLETTSSQNSVKIKVTQTGFVVSDTLFLSSSDLINTAGSKIVSINSLSDNLTIFDKKDNVALLTTSDQHGVGVGDKITVDINPDDSLTETTQYVRTRIYQEAVLQIPVIARVLSDTGIGRIEILNSGANYTDGVYLDVALSGGTGSDAKAKITVENNLVTKVEITEKGSGYKQFDLLTVGDTDLSKTDTSDPRLKVRVDHIGFSVDNNKLQLDSVLDIKINDYLNIGSEIVKVTGIDGSKVVVSRAQKETAITDHFNGASVTVYDAGFNLSSGYKINQTNIVSEDANNPIVLSYDNITHKVVFVYEYEQTLTSIDKIEISTIFFDESTPSTRIVNVLSVSDPKICFEFSDDQNGTFVRNPFIDIKKYYKYKFDVSHSSMNGYRFDISPSINLNLVTTEKIVSSNIVDLKLGFGPRISSNTYSNKIDVFYTKYYYFDKNGIVDSEGSYFNVIEDSLQGEKTPLYVTPNRIVYSTDIKATNDGSGDISYTSQSLFSVGKINSIRISNIGTDYKKIPIVTGIYDIEGNLDTSVECYLNSTTIGVPRNVKMINNGGGYHNDMTLSSDVTSNYILTLTNFNSDAFGVGETIVQKSGSVEVARARVTSWRNGSNILTVDRIVGAFRKNQQIIGLSGANTATIKDVSFTKFTSDIKTYYDNLGFYKSDFGKLSDSNQKITDSYYYQDYSYLVKSNTPINIWRSLIKETTHPAGFQLFGEVLIESSGQVKMPNNTNTSRVSILQVWDPEKNKITIESTRRQITQNIILMKNLNVEKGVGSVSVDTASTSEISAGDVFLTPEFNGGFTDKGNLEGRTVFTLIDKNNNVVRPYNEQALIITLDGILQEPGVAYKISGDKITFAQPPIGPSVKGGQSVPGVSFYGKKFEFKTDALNARYLKKIRNIFQRNGRWIDASNQLDFNKNFIQSEALGYIKNKYPVLSWGSLQSKCRRDIGLIVDALSHDLRFGGNERTVLAAESYFTNGVLTSVAGQGVLVDPNDPTGDKVSELEAAVEAFSYVVRLCKLAMRNWDFIAKGVSWTPGTNEIQIGDTGNIAIGMKVSAGRAFPEGTRVTEILDERRIRVSENAKPLANTSVNTILSNTTTDVDTDTVNSILQIAPDVYLQIGSDYYFALTPVNSVLPSDNAQMAFIWSGVNTGTYYDASLLIQKNKINIQREATHRISDAYRNFTYPGVPEEAFRFKDARRLIYKNINDIVDKTITAITTEYPSHSQYEDKCRRDLKIILSAISEDVGRGGNSATLASIKAFFDYSDASSTGEVTESVYGYNYAKDLCIKAINNDGGVTDPNITTVSNCSNVNSSITTLFGLLTTALTDNQEPSVTRNTGISSWVKCEDICYRDTGLYVDAIVHCLRFGGNQKVIEFAEAYFNKFELRHVSNELAETIYAFNQARDLMIKAMRNQISGDTIITPITDSLVRGDTQTPVCNQIESAITTYAAIVENTLESGPNRIEIVPKNLNSTGNWTSLTSYSDINILTDPDLVNGILKECEDVASALETLNGVLNLTMTSGPGTIEISNPDYIDGKNKIFDLYYTDGTEVNTDPQEDLFVALSGVLQHKPAYTIDRTTVPNKIVFDSPPIWGQNDNTKTVYEPLAVDKFFAHGVGSYIRCTVNVDSPSPGPFLLLDSNDEAAIISAPKFALVFIDGVLQREGVSYNITGSAIRFSRNIYRNNNVEILVLYGRDIEPSITLYDFEPNEYYNEIILTLSAQGGDSFNAWADWYGLSHDHHQVAYQKVGGVKKFIGNVKSYKTVIMPEMAAALSDLIITIAGDNPDLDESPIFFASIPGFEDEYEFPTSSRRIDFVKNEYDDHRMQRNTARWLYGTKRADEAFYERKRGGANLIAGDLIKIDGEEDYRTVNELPQYVNPKTYNSGEYVSNSFFGSCSTTNYGGDTRGVGLSATCQVSDGKVTSVSWNRTDFQLLHEQGILKPSDAKNYDSTPVLHFIPVDQVGGGARAEVIVSDGEVVDIVLTDTGSGYTKAPNIVTARQYDVIKQRGRKIDSLLNIKIENDLIVNNLGVHVEITPIRGVEPCTTCGTPGPLLPGDPNNPTHPDPHGLLDGWSGSLFQMTSFIVRPIDLPAPVAIPQEVNRYFPTVVDSVRMPDISHTSQGTSILELGSLDLRFFMPNVWVTTEGIRITYPPGPGGPPGGLPPGTPGNPNEKRYTYQCGFVDHRRYVNPPTLENMTMRPSFFQWEGAKFMSTGDILSNGGQSVSEYTIEEFDRYGFNIGQFESNAKSGWADDGYSFNIAYPTINNYLSQIEVDNVPDPLSGDYIQNGAVIYAKTRLFPISGVISLGKEKIYYTNKLPDRFLGCVRGYDNTIIEGHPVGRYIRNA